MNFLLDMMLKGISSEFCALEEIGRDEVGGVIVSTILTPDAGYETAILDEEKAMPVERYGDATAAKIGHLEWCEKAPTLTEVNRIGLKNGDWDIEDKVMQIVRK